MDLITISLNLITILLLVYYFFGEKIILFFQNTFKDEKIKEDPVIYYNSLNNNFSDEYDKSDVDASDVFLQALKDPNNRIRTDFNEELEGSIGTFEGHYVKPINFRQI